MKYLMTLILLLVGSGCIQHDEDVVFQPDQDSIYLRCVQEDDGLYLEYNASGLLTGWMIEDRYIYLYESPLRIELEEGYYSFTLETDSGVTVTCSFIYDNYITVCKVPPGHNKGKTEWKQSL